MSSFNSQILFFFVLIIFVYFNASQAKGNGKHDTHGSIHVMGKPIHKTKNSHRPTKPTPSKPPPTPRVAMFNVLDYGAKGNGISDDTKAFLAAWGDACTKESSTLLIPSGYVFLVGPLSLLGPCQPNIVLQLDGTVIAPTNPSYWKSGSMKWLQLKQLTKGITIQGGGLIEGQGNAWWGNAHRDETNFPRQLGAQRKGKLPNRRPTALKFYGSYNVTVNGITIQNSPQCHLKFDNCDNVRVSNITISSPGDSPNTDGIHLQNSANVEIRQSVISCGDDCISIQTGSSTVHVQSVTCGPGHGISIGSLGEGRTTAWVSNITVKHVAFVGTLTGVRIKTWQGGSGSVRDVKFSNIRVSRVQTPIVIDQYYSDGRSSKNQSSAVAISQISYDTIIGTYTEQPVYLACSNSFPCKALSIANLDLEPEEEKYHMLGPFCWQAYGVLHGLVIPPVDCLKQAV